MSIILPTAPTNFYTPSLEKLKDDVLAVNNITQGQITLFSQIPEDANTAWGEVGAGNPDIDSNRGSYVIGQATIEVITGPTPAYNEASEEYGYKLNFAKISGIEIDLQGSDISSLLTGFAVIIGRDRFVEGTDDDVRYLGKIEDVIITNSTTNRIRRLAQNDDLNAGVRNFPVENGDIIELPQWSLIINYAEPIA